MLTNRSFSRDRSRKTGLCNSCKVCYRSYHENYYSRKRDEVLRRKRASARHRLPEVRDYIRAYRNKNAISLRAKKREYERLRRRSDINFRLKGTLRRRITHALLANGIKKFGRTEILLGCPVETLRRHIETAWSVGMSWDNYGLKGWHIDHIRPCASFDLTDPKKQKECFNWENLQPLWHTDNRRKGAKYGTT